MESGVRRMTYSVEEAAAVLGMSKSKLYDSVRNGELRGVQLGRRVVIPSDALEALVGQSARSKATGRHGQPNLAAANPRVSHPAKAAPKSIPSN